MIKHIGKYNLESGDRIALEVASSDIDMPDATVWMRVVEVIGEGKEKEYSVVFPDGEDRRGTIRAEHIGRYKTAAQFAIDEYDYEETNRIWADLTVKTKGHEYSCLCDDCTALYALFPALNDQARRIAQARFADTRARLAA